MLRILINIVASKFAYSIDSRILNKYKDRLLPENVEAIIFTSNWKHGFCDCNSFNLKNINIKIKFHWTKIFNKKVYRGEFNVIIVLVFTQKKFDWTKMFSKKVYTCESNVIILIIFTKKKFISCVIFFYILYDKLYLNFFSYLHEKYSPSFVIFFIFLWS